MARSEWSGQTLKRLVLRNRSEWIRRRPGITGDDRRETGDDSRETDDDSRETMVTVERLVVAVKRLVVTVERLVVTVERLVVTVKRLVMTVERLSPPRTLSYPPKGAVIVAAAGAPRYRGHTGSLGFVLEVSKIVITTGRTYKRLRERNRSQASSSSSSSSCSPSAHDPHK